MPFQVIGDTGVYASVPQLCSTSGGTANNTISSFGSNGIIGVGINASVVDCGNLCGTGGSSAAIYFECPSSGCINVAAVTPTAVQVPNPVARFAVDNTGTILTLPDPLGPKPSLTGTLTIGIGTQANNAYNATTTIRTTSSGSFSINYNNATSLTRAFIDSGTNIYAFADKAIALCTSTGLKGFYCPGTAKVLSAVTTTNQIISFTLNDASQIAVGANTVLPGLGADPSSISTFQTSGTSFVFGLPFFYGRSVYTVLTGASVGTFSGPAYGY